MKIKRLPLIALSVLLAGGMAVATSASLLQTTKGDDCPGLIHCPLTDEVICSKECPVLPPPACCSLPE